jgi:hypothetical protein
LRLALATTVASLALAGTALAQVPTTPQNPPPPPPSAPAPAPAAPAAAKISIGIGTGIRDHGKTYVIDGQKVLVNGRLKPFVAGQTVLVELFRGHKRVSRQHAKVKKAGGGAGSFAVSFRARGTGNYTVRARHFHDTAQAAATSHRKGFSTLSGSAGSGSRGENVKLLQRGLARLAYVTSRGGSFDAATGRAVLAFRKVNGMSRTQSASRQVFQMVFAGQGGFHLRYPNAGHHAEFDWSRQVLVLADHGHPERIYHASSGKPSTPTVFGSFSFYRKTPGTNSHGMVDSSYFFTGYAVHGYADVPAFAASHGCIRVPIPNASAIFNWIHLGDKIFVYR